MPVLTEMSGRVLCENEHADTSIESPYSSEGAFTVLGVGGQAWGGVSLFPQ